MIRFIIPATYLTTTYRLIPYLFVLFLSSTNQSVHASEYPSFGYSALWESSRNLREHRELLKSLTGERQAYEKANQAKEMESQSSCERLDDNLEYCRKETKSLRAYFDQHYKDDIDKALLYNRVKSRLEKTAREKSKLMQSFTKQFKNMSGLSEEKVSSPEKSEALPTDGGSFNQVSSEEMKQTIIRRIGMLIHILRKLDLPKDYKGSGYPSNWVVEIGKVETIYGLIDLLAENNFLHDEIDRTLQYESASTPGKKWWQIDFGQSTPLVVVSGNDLDYNLSEFFVNIAFQLKNKVLINSLFGSIVKLGRVLADPNFIRRTETFTLFKNYIFWLRENLLDEESVIRALSDFETILRGSDPWEVISDLRILTSWLHEHNVNYRLPQFMSDFIGDLAKGDAKLKMDTFVDTLALFQGQPSEIVLERQLYSNRRYIPKDIGRTASVQEELKTMVLAMRRNLPTKRPTRRFIDSTSPECSDAIVYLGEKLAASNIETSEIVRTLHQLTTAPLVSSDVSTLKQNSDWLGLEPLVIVLQRNNRPIDAVDNVRLLLASDPWSTIEVINEFSWNRQSNSQKYVEKPTIGSHFLKNIVQNLQARQSLVENIERISSELAIVRADLILSSGEPKTSFDPEKAEQYRRARGCLEKLLEQLRRLKVLPTKDEDKTSETSETKWFSYGEVKGGISPSGEILDKRSKREFLRRALLMKKRNLQLSFRRMVPSLDGLVVLGSYSAANILEISFNQWLIKLPGEASSLSWNDIQPLDNFAEKLQKIGKLRSIYDLIDLLLESGFSGTIVDLIVRSIGENANKLSSETSELFLHSQLREEIASLALLPIAETHLMEFLAQVVSLNGTVNHLHSSNGPEIVAKIRNLLNWTNKQSTDAAPTIETLSHLTSLLRYPGDSCVLLTEIDELIRWFDSKGERINSKFVANFVSTLIHKTRDSQPYSGPPQRRIDLLLDDLATEDRPSTKEIISSFLENNEDECCCFRRNRAAVTDLVKLIVLFGKKKLSPRRVSSLLEVFLFQTALAVRTPSYLISTNNSTNATKRIAAWVEESLSNNISEKSIVGTLNELAQLLSSGNSPLKTAENFAAVFADQDRSTADIITDFIQYCRNQRDSESFAKADEYFSATIDVTEDFWARMPLAYTKSPNSKSRTQNDFDGPAVYDLELGRLNTKALEPANDDCYESPCLLFSLANRVKNCFKCCRKDRVRSHTD